MILSHMNETAKNATDAVSVSALFAVLVNALPTVTAVLVLLWTMMRIYETWLAIALKRRRLDEGELGPLEDED